MAYNAPRAYLIVLVCGILQAKQSKLAIPEITPNRTRNYVRKWIVDSGAIGQQLWTERSLKIFSGFLPFYLTGRHVDEKIHSYFYEAVTHENKHQPPQLLQYFVEYEIMEIPAWICRFLSIAARDPEERRAMQFFTTGLAWSLLAKLLIKQIVGKLKLEAGLRPLHPGFNRNWKYYHGTPSGHSILIAFTATYLGFYKGRHYGIPLGLYTGFIMGMRVAGNHHFLSQVFTGAAVGILFGASSYAAFQKREWPQRFAFGLVSEFDGRFGASLSYHF